MKRVLSIAVSVVGSAVLAPAAHYGRKERPPKRKELEMRTSKWHILRWFTVAFATAAIVAPTAQADPRSLDDIDPSLAAAVRQEEAGLLSPDDRPFYRGPSDTAPGSLSPDDRPFARSVGEIVLTSAPAEVVASPRGFDWGDAVIGGTFGLALALLGTGAILIAHRSRSTPKTA
jgi:hypothetical protein